MTCRLIMIYMPLPKLLTLIFSLATAASAALAAIYWYLSSKNQYQSKAQVRLSPTTRKHTSWMRKLASMLSRSLLTKLRG
jgi:hypothetical protein